MHMFIKWSVIELVILFSIVGILEIAPDSIVIVDQRLLPISVLLFYMLFCIPLNLMTISDHEYINQVVSSYNRKNGNKF